MITEKEANKRWGEYFSHLTISQNQRDLFEWPDTVPPVMIMLDGETYFGTREEAIALGVMRDPNKPLTLRERITEKIQKWHSRMAVWHERRSIGLRWLAWSK